MAKGLHIEKLVSFRMPKISEAQLLRMGPKRAARDARRVIEPGSVTATPMRRRENNLGRASKRSGDERT